LSGSGRGGTQGHIGARILVAEPELAAPQRHGRHTRDLLRGARDPAEPARAARHVFDDQVGIAVEPEQAFIVEQHDCPSVAPRLQLIAREQLLRRPDLRSRAAVNDKHGSLRAQDACQRVAGNRLREGRGCVAQQRYTQCHPYPDVFLPHATPPSRLPLTGWPARRTW
jgi:hypothetical protein